MTLPLLASHMDPTTFKSLSVLFKKDAIIVVLGHSLVQRQKWSVYCVIGELIFTTGKLALLSLHFDSTSVRLSGVLNYVALNQSGPERLCRQLRAQAVK